MIFRRKITAGILSVVAFGSVLTGVAVNNNTHNQANTECEAQGLHTSAGAIAHIEQNDNTISAGALSTVMDETVVDVVDRDSTTEGQPSDVVSEPESDPATETDLSQYDTFGYTNL